MPLPKPTTSQTKEQFIEHFMSEAKEEYPDDKQRLAVACSQWEETVSKALTFEVVSKASDEGLVSGWANVSVQSDGSIPLDWQGDVIPTGVLEKAAINFMLDYRGSGVQHMGEVQGVVVESIVFSKEKQRALHIPDGIVPEGWFITVKVTNPDVFKRVKDGTLRMFSIQGKAKRVDI